MQLLLATTTNGAAFNHLLLTAGTFLGVSMVMFLLGRMMIGPARNRTEDALGEWRPLVLGRFTEAFARVLPVRETTRETLCKDLVRAGYFHRLAVTEYLGLRNAAVAGWMIFLATALALLDPTGQSLIRFATLGSAILLLLFSIPRIVLSSQANARAQRIGLALPDALDMVSMAMMGGVPLEHALKRVGRDIASAYPDLACELELVHYQADAGSLRQALEQFADRIDLPDVTTLATLVGQSERLGGNTVGAFQEFADVVRRTRRLRAEESGNKASVKLMFPVVLCLAPPVYVLLLGPAVLELRDFVRNQDTGALSEQVEQANRAPTSDPEWIAFE